MTNITHFFSCFPETRDIYTDGGGALAVRNYGGRVVEYSKPFGGHLYDGADRIVVVNGRIVEHFSLCWEKGKPIIHDSGMSNLIGKWAFGLGLRKRGYTIITNESFEEYCSKRS